MGEGRGEQEGERRGRDSCIGSSCHSSACDSTVGHTHTHTHTHAHTQTSVAATRTGVDGSSRAINSVSLTVFFKNSSLPHSAVKAREKWWGGEWGFGRCAIVCIYRMCCMSMSSRSQWCVSAHAKNQGRVQGRVHLSADSIISHQSSVTRIHNRFQSFSNSNPWCVCVSMSLDGKGDPSRGWCMFLFTRIRKMAAASTTDGCDKKLYLIRCIAS